MEDHGLTLEEAFHQQRIDMSGGGKATADRTLPQPVIDALKAAFPTTTAVRTNFPYAFACPSAVLRDGEVNMGCTEIMSPWATRWLKARPPTLECSSIIECSPRASARCSRAGRSYDL